MKKVKIELEVELEEFVLLKQAVHRYMDEMENRYDRSHGEAKFQSLDSKHKLKNLLQRLRQQDGST